MFVFLQIYSKSKTEIYHSLTLLWILNVVTWIMFPSIPCCNCLKYFLRVYPISVSCLNYVSNTCLLT